MYGVTPGNYRVYEVPQPGWMQTSPAGGYNAVTVTANNVSGGNNFGNTRSPASDSGSPSPLFTGESYTLSLGYSGAHAPESWSIDWGDGTPVQTINGNPSSFSHTFAAGSGAGFFSIDAIATGPDGAASALPVSVKVYTAPTLSNGTLSLAGTSGNDTVSFTNSSGTF